MTVSKPVTALLVVWCLVSFCETCIISATVWRKRACLGFCGVVLGLHQHMCACMTGTGSRCSVSFVSTAYLKMISPMYIREKNAKLRRMLKMSLYLKTDE